jgi:hypothetical protein
LLEAKLSQHFSHLVDLPLDRLNSDPIAAAWPTADDEAGESSGIRLTTS